MVSSSSSIVVTPGDDDGGDNDDQQFHCRGSFRLNSCDFTMVEEPQGNLHASGIGLLFVDRLAVVAMEHLRDDPVLA